MNTVVYGTGGAAKQLLEKYRDSLGTVLFAATNTGTFLEQQAKLDEHLDI